MEHFSRSLSCHIYFQLLFISSHILLPVCTRFKTFPFGVGFFVYFLHLLLLCLFLAPAFILFIFYFYFVYFPHLLFLCLFSALLLLCLFPAPAFTLFISCTCFYFVYCPHRTLNYLLSRMIYFNMSVYIPMSGWTLLG